MERIDLSGRRFGALTAIRPVSADDTADHRPGWLVRCDCGREKVVNGSNLRRGKITSCGCGMEKAKKQSHAMLAKNAHEDLTGQTFGELTAVSYIRTDYWLWRCSCGQEIKARPSLVKPGNILSCGHILRETARRKIVEQNTVEHYDGTTVSRLRQIMASPTVHGIRKRYDANGNAYYQARLMLRGQYIHLGTYATRTEAEKARRRGEETYYLPIIEAFDKQNQEIKGE